MEVYWSEFGECYITPVSDTQVGVAILPMPTTCLAIPMPGKFDALLEWFQLSKRRSNPPNHSPLFEGLVDLNKD